MASAHTLTGPGRYWLLPTLAWVDAGDGALLALCGVGCALAVLLVAGVLPWVVTPLLWLMYLSLSVVCREFLSYQWDALLLETACGHGSRAVRRERLGSLPIPPRVAVALMLWLLFRLMVGSGAVKLTSGDPTWHTLTALTVHFETQPIPTPLAWYAHQLPLWLLKAATIAVFAIEIGAPFLILAPRRLRQLAFMLLVGLQVLIALTGNYAFFNLLAAALCLFLLDDAALGSWQTLDPRRRRHEPAERGRCWSATVATVPVSAVAFTTALGISPPGLVVRRSAGEPDCAVPNREPLRSICCHDDDPSGDHPRRIGGWRHVGRYEFQEQGRGINAAAHPGLPRISRGSTGKCGLLRWAKFRRGAGVQEPLRPAARSG